MTALRETINESFDKERALADGVLFEFGHSRQEDWPYASRAPAMATATAYAVRDPHCLAEMPAPAARFRIARGRGRQPSWSSTTG